jgi:hypothetical protein
MNKALRIWLSAVIAWAAMLTLVYSANEPALETQLQGLNARQALALANQWHWERQPVRTHITSQAVVFEFENGVTKRISLPKDQMMVAVAPYISRTHT